MAGRLLDLDDLRNAIVHLLDGLELGQSHAALVGDVVDAALGLGVLTAGTAHLQVVLVGGCLQLRVVLGQLRHLDVDRGADGGAKVGRAEGQEAETVVVRERDALLDVVDGGHQTAVDLAEIATHLHRDDAQMVLLVAPDQEGLVVVVVDTATGRPVAARVGGLQETVALLEQEVIVDQLLLDGLVHAGQRVELALQLTLQPGQRGRHLALHLLVLGLGQAGVERVALHRATATDAGRHDELAGRVDVAEGVHITEVTGRSSMIGSNKSANREYASASGA
uniref:Uncharacterized protein n=1 Tax=Anopheles merus TaxID=30066 RepID=A0A182VAI8_ANOME